MERVPNSVAKRPPGADDSVWLDDVRQRVASLRFGVVQIVVHDSRVVQIEKTERWRLDKPRSSISEGNQNGEAANTSEIQRNDNEL